MEHFLDVREINRARRPIRWLRILTLAFACLCLGLLLGDAAAWLVTLHRPSIIIGGLVGGLAGWGIHHLTKPLL